MTTSALTLVEVRPGLKFSLAALRNILPDVEVALFFSKLYKLDAYQVGRLLGTLFNTTLVQALTRDDGNHSHELQDYVLELGFASHIESGAITFGVAPPTGEVLPELWKAAEVQVAKSIEEVAEKCKDLVGALPGKQGEMVFRSLMTVNAKRPTLGDYKASIRHANQLPNLVIFDVSGSMTEETVRILVEDTVAMSYMANAHLATVSDTATHWMPGEYSSESVLDVAEYGGTHYEELAPLLDQNWGVVICVADYDSSPAAASVIANCRGSIELVLDISLVNRPTYLSEVVGQLAKEVKPLMVAATNLTGSGW